MKHAKAGEGDLWLAIELTCRADDFQSADMLHMQVCQVFIADSWRTMNSRRKPKKDDWRLVSHYFIFLQLECCPVVDPVASYGYSLRQKGQQLLPFQSRFALLTYLSIGRKAFVKGSNHHHLHRCMSHPSSPLFSRPASRAAATVS